MYSLPQVDILTNQQLVQLLELKGYATFKHTTGLWRHKWITIKLLLVVDNFGVKYVGKQHVEHLIQIIKEHYQTPSEWEGQRLCGIRIKWS